MLTEGVLVLPHVRVQFSVYMYSTCTKFCALYLAMQFGQTCMCMGVVRWVIVILNEYEMEIRIHYPPSKTYRLHRVIG